MIGIVSNMVYLWYTVDKTIVRDSFFQKATPHKEIPPNQAPLYLKLSESHVLTKIKLSYFLP